MKTFIEFESLLSKEPIVLDGVRYEVDDLYKLDGYSYDVYEGFNINKEIVSRGFFYWNSEKSIMYTRIWLESIELDSFYKEIISGHMIPVNIRITPDNINSWSVKKMSDNYVNKMIEEYNDPEKL